MPYEVLEHTGFLELRLFGVVDGQSSPETTTLQQFADSGKLLVDTADVQSLTADVMWMASVVQRAFTYGPFKTAVVSNDDIVFGTLRQVSSYRGPSPEGTTVAFFRDRSEALSWLLAAS